jgi:hypothetical protein
VAKPLSSCLSKHGDDDNNGDGVTGYDDNGNDTMATARQATKSTINRCEWK